MRKSFSCRDWLRLLGLPWPPKVSALSTGPGTGSEKVPPEWHSDFPLGFGHQSLTRLLPRFREVALRLRPSLVGAGFHPAESIPDAMARDRLEHRVDQVPPLARRRLPQRLLERRHRLQCPLEAQVPWLLVMGLGRLGHHASDQVVSE